MEILHKIFTAMAGLALMALIGILFWTLGSLVVAAVVEGNFAKVAVTAIVTVLGVGVIGATITDPD